MCYIVHPGAMIPIINHRSKFVNDGWMIENGFLSADEESSQKWWWDKKVEEISVVKPKTVKPSDSIATALEMMNK